jgi:acetyl esterase/lipase
VPTAVAACLSYFSPTGAATGPLFRQALPLPPNSSEQAWREVEIEPHIKGMPPTAIFQGLADTLVAPEVSETLARQLRAANVPCELHAFGGVSHEFVEFPEFADACARLNDFFLDRYVINPKTYPAFGAGRGGGRRGGGPPQQP